MFEALDLCPSCGADFADDRCTGAEICQTQVDHQVAIVKAEMLDAPYAR